MFIETLPCAVKLNLQFSFKIQALATIKKIIKAANCQILAWLLKIKIIILSDIAIISPIRKIMPDNTLSDIILRKIIILPDIQSGRNFVLIGYIIVLGTYSY